jgi:hypothetical protein
MALSAFGVWRSLLTRPWGYLIVAVVLSYALMAATVFYALQGIGIAGNHGETAPSFGPVERRMALLLFAYLVISAAALFGVTFLFRKG